MRELPLPHGFFIEQVGCASAGAPGAVGDLVAIPGAARVLPRLHHDRMLGTPPGLQAARDQSGPHNRLHKRGLASFRDHVQAHLVCSQTLLIARVIDEEPELPVEPAPIGFAVSEEVLHGWSPLSGHGWLKDCAVARGLHKQSEEDCPYKGQSSQRMMVVFHTFLISSKSSSLTLRAFHASMIAFKFLGADFLGDLSRVAIDLDFHGLLLSWV